jgi:DNA-binding MarR family transcriptional regulator
MTTGGDSAQHNLFTPVGFAAMLALRGRDYTTSTEIERLLEMQLDSLDVELQRLVDAGYVETVMDTVDQKAELTYRVTEQGREAFLRYVTWLKQVITQVE